MGHPDVVRALVYGGADLEISDWNGWTPLMKAIYRNNFEIAKILVENGANVNAKNTSGYSVLYIGEKLNRQSEILQLLVSAGATR
jgi:ankyrin repeat protein